MSVLEMEDGTFWRQVGDEELGEWEQVEPMEALELIAMSELRASSVDVGQKLYTSADLFQMKIDKPPCLIKPWLPRSGAAMIYGMDGLGKSFFTTQLASDVANGKPFLGFETEKCVVVYIQCDMTSFVQHDRILTQKDWLSYNLYWVLGGMDKPITHLKGDERWVQEVQALKPDLIIWDTLAKIHNMDENDNSSPGVVYGAARKLFGFDPCMIFVHHPRKDGEGFSNQQQSYRGAVAWRANIDATIRLAGHKGKIRVHFDKARICAPIDYMTVEIDPLTLGMKKAGKTPSEHIRDMKKLELPDKEIVARLVATDICSQSYAYKLLARNGGDS